MMLILQNNLNVSSDSFGKELHRLLQANNIAQKIDVYFNLVCSSLMLIGTCVGLAIGICRGSFRKLPVKIRIALVMNLVMQISVINLNIITLETDCVGFVG